MTNVEGNIINISSSKCILFELKIQNLKKKACLNNFSLSIGNITERKININELAHHFFCFFPLIL